MDSGVPVQIPAAIPTGAAEHLATAEVTLLGRMPNASNATFLVRLDPAGTELPDDENERAQPLGLAIYKPLRGERPLWDFPPGLHRREVAAYRLSHAAGLHVVPPTVLRTDAPLGEGSLQWFVNADFAEHFFSLFEQRPQLHDQFRALAAFDVIVNNTDRKSGHCLFEPATEQVWGIDNGLCFSEDARLRTVIWNFAGEPLGDTLRAVAAAIADEVPDDVAELLDDDEVEAMQERAAELTDEGIFPFDRSGHGYPWPLI
ncbi:SCO1664 family protein [Desertimonas flava]|jgi:uncharacterized repeat protein (TIGR03843 family)|uniref:SCO1664 family protein n=1 Tax=Desertimonas flava TaxID=2064846 RepID=UPI000E34F2D0|nr:SCO1664 family protein [Desertimonas flava]